MTKLELVAAYVAAGAIVCYVVSPALVAGLAVATVIVSLGYRKVFKASTVTGISPKTPVA